MSRAGKMYQVHYRWRYDPSDEEHDVLIAHDSAGEAANRWLDVHPEAEVLKVEEYEPVWTDAG